MGEVALKKPPKIKTWLTFILILALLYASAVKTEATFGELFTGLPEMGKLLRKMFPPDWRYAKIIAAPMIQTIQMAILGTTIGAAIAIPVAIFSARNITKSKLLNGPARFILNLVRTVPDLLYASIFVAIFGIGPIAGVLALSFFSFGLIAKLTYESIEAIDPGPLEAMTAVGANKLQWIHFGVVPQVLASFVAYLLYTFEINVRAAAVLGLVGAGGIGFNLEATLGLFRYNQTSVIIIVTLVLVLLIDYVSIKIREKLL
jgi:phosphonate transport system permease protein